VFAVFHLYPVLPTAIFSLCTQRKVAAFLTRSSTLAGALPLLVRTYLDNRRVGEQPDASGCRMHFLFFFFLFSFFGTKTASVD
jgi:hypothetical protein